MEDFSYPATGNRKLDDLIVRLRKTLRSLAKAVTNDRLVTQAIATVDTRVYHGLDAAPVTWEVVGINAAASVYESATANPDRARFLILQASAAATVTLRFS